AGVSTENFIATDTRAYIDGDGSGADAGILADAIEVLALDESTIEVDAGAAAVGGSVGGTVGVSASIGVSLARNSIDNSVVAYIQNADDVVATAGDVTVDAREDAQIDATSVAASLAVAVSGTVSVALAGAGAEATNVITNDVQAYVLDSMVSTAQAEFDGSQELSELLQGQRVRLSDGSVFEFIGEDRLEADQVGPDGLPLPIRLAFEDYSPQSTQWSRVGSDWDVRVDATSESELSALVGAAASAVSGGLVAVSGSVGVAIARNLVGLEEVDGTPRQNQVVAYIEDSTIAAAGDVTVHADALERIATDSFAGSVAIAVGIGAAFAGSGATATSRFSTLVDAHIDDSMLQVGGDLTVEAVDDSQITSARAVGASLSVSLGAASVAVSLVDNVIANKVDASIDGTTSSQVVVGGDVVVESDIAMASIDEVSAVTASVSGGLQGFSGGGIVVDNRIENDVDAGIRGNADVLAFGDVSVHAREEALISADASAVTVSISLGAALGVAVVDSEIRSSIEAAIDVADEHTVMARNIDVFAESIATIPTTTTAGIAASLSAAADNEAHAKIATSVTAFATGGELKTPGTLSIRADAENFARTSALGGALGAVAAGGMVSDIELGRVGNDHEVQARIGASTDVMARAVLISASASDDLLADSTAGAAGLAALIGAGSSVTSDFSTLAEIGEGTTILSDALTLKSFHQQDFDTKADAYSLALAAGTGAFATNTITSTADVKLGDGSGDGPRITSGNVLINASNEVTKNRFANDNNLKTGSAALGAASVLLSSTELGTASDPLRARVDVLGGTTITAVGDSEDPGFINISAFNEFTGVDSVSVETVAGYAIAVGRSDLAANSLAQVNVDGASLINGSGDIFLTTRSDGALRPSGNLFMAALLSGAEVQAVADMDVRNEVRTHDATLRGSDVYLYAGRDSGGKVNLLDSEGNVEITTISLVPSFSFPVLSATIDEFNTVSVLGKSKIQALEDVNIVALEGLGGSERARTDGTVLNLSLIPFGVDIPDGGTTHSTNQVDVGTNARIEAGINNKSVVEIHSVQANPLPAGVSLDPGSDPDDPQNRVPVSVKTQLGLAPDIDYEYVALDFGEIPYTISTGMVIEVIEGFNGGGLLGHFYEFRPPGVENAPLLLEAENYAIGSRWKDLGDDASAIDSSIDPVRSDVTSTFDALQGLFYAIKPVDLAAPVLTYVNIGNKLIEEREKIRGWIANHAGNAEAVARYEIQLGVVEQALMDLGLLETFEDGGQMQTAVKRGLDAVFVDMPDVYAAPGSVFIDVSGVSPSTFEPLVTGGQIVARAGAEIELVNNSPFAMSVNDAVIRDNARVTVSNGEFVVFQPGNVYVNNANLTNTADGDEPQISIRQPLDTVTYDLGGIELPDIPQDLFIQADVINESGHIFIQNEKSSINVSGEIRGKTVEILSGGDFNLNVDDWLHTNQDPRQLIDFNEFRAPALAGGSGTLIEKTNRPASIEAAIGDEESKIVAQGSVVVTARFLNINGRIQSGVDTVEIKIDADTFVAPGQTQSFLDDDGNALPGISFGTDDVPVAGFFDAERQALVLGDIIPKGGEITLAGQILSTGGGLLRVAHGYTNVNIQNETDYELVLNRINTLTEREGKITIIDTATLSRVEYTLDANQITEKVFSGELIEGDPNTEGGEISTIAYTLEETNALDKNDAYYDDVQTGRVYVWTEGQEKTQSNVVHYEKKSFNLFGDNSFADFLAKDSSYTWRKTVYTDGAPLLESELLAMPDTPEFNTNPDFTIVPDYAAGDSYTIFYELRTDNDVDVLSNASWVKDGGTVYKYIGDMNKEVNLQQVDYASDPEWAVDTSVSFSETDTAAYRYLSTFKNMEVTKESWTTGGGWLRKKTVHTSITTIQGLVDYYTHTLEAADPIKIEFDEGPSASDTPDITIVSHGGVFIQGNIESPDFGAVTIISEMGSIDSAENVGVFGVVPTLSAGVLNGGGISGLVRIAAEPLVNPDAVIRLNVQNGGRADFISGGDIFVTGISTDNQHSEIFIGNLTSYGGSIFVTAPDGIFAFDANSIISGERIELLTTRGAIGTEALPIRIDSNVVGDGGVAARSGADIYLVEVDGDMRLLTPRMWDPDVDSTPSIETTLHVDFSLANTPNELITGQSVELADGRIMEFVGDSRLDPDDLLPPVDLASENYADPSQWKEVGLVQLTVLDGSLLDARYEDLTPKTLAEAQALGDGLGITGDSAIAYVDAQILRESSSQTERYHSYWVDFRDAVRTSAAATLTVQSIDAGTDTLTFSGDHGLSSGDQVVLQIGIDLSTETFSDGATWSEVMGFDADFDVSQLQTARTVLANGDVVRASDGTLYRYDGISVPLTDLVDGQEYYAVVLDATTIQLALNRTDAALVGTPEVVDFGALVGAGGDAGAVGGFVALDVDSTSYTVSAYDAGLAVPTNLQQIHDLFGAGSYDPDAVGVIRQDGGSPFLSQVTDAERQDRITARTVDVAKLQFPISRGLFNYLFPEEPSGNFPTGPTGEGANIVARDIELNVDGGQVGRVSGTEIIDLTNGFDVLTPTQQQLLAISTSDSVVGHTYAIYQYTGNGDTFDLTTTDFQTGPWTKIDYIKTGDVTGPMSVAQGDRVLVQTGESYGLYEFQGQGSQSIDLRTQDYTDDSRWRLFDDVHVGHVFDSGDDNAQLAMHDFVEDLSQVDHLTLKVFDDIDLEAEHTVRIASQGGIAVETQGILQVDEILGGGDTKLVAGGSILDLGTAPYAAIGSLGDLALISRGGSIRAASGTDPMRIQVSSNGELTAEALGQIDLVQVAGTVTIDAVSEAVSDLWIRRVDGGQAVVVETDTGDMYVKQVTSDDSVRLVSASSILDAFEDSGRAKINVDTHLVSAPASGDVYLTAVVDIGQLGNFLDVDMGIGDLVTQSGRDTFIHGADDLEIASAVSATGDIHFVVDGDANVDQITALLGTVKIVAEAGIIDRRDDDEANVSATNAILNAGTGVGSPSNRFDTVVSRLESAVPGGGLWLRNTGDLEIGGISSQLGIATLIDVDIIAASDITVGEAIDTEHGPVLLDASEDITVHAPITTGGGTVTLYADGDIVFGVTTNGGAVVGAETGSIDTESDSPTVTLLADADATGGGAIAMADGSWIDATGGLIDVDATGDIVLGYLTTSTDVVIDSSAGSVLDTADSAGFEPKDIEAGTAVIHAATGIGTAANPLETTLVSFEADGGAGGIYVDDMGGLTLGDVGTTPEGLATTGLLANSTIRVTTTGFMTIVENVVSSSADVTLSAIDSPNTTVIVDPDLSERTLALDGSDFDEDLILTAGSVVSGATDVTLLAGDDLLLDAGTTVTAGEALTIRGDHQQVSGVNVDPGVGSRIDLDGSIDSTTTLITGERDDDYVDFQVEALAGHTTVEGDTDGLPGGSDTIRLDRLPTIATSHDRPGDPAGAALVRDTIDLDGRGGSDHVIVNLSGDRTDYLVNVVDSGAQNDGADTLTIFGTEQSDLFLLRKHFVALLNPTEQQDPDAQMSLHPELERINYDQSINGRVRVESGVGDDAFYVDDNSALTTLDGGQGDDTFQIGQIFGSNPNGGLFFSEITTPDTAWTPEASYEDVGAASTTGSGTGMRVDISVDALGHPSAALVDPGQGYQDGDQVTFVDPGGVGDPVTLTIVVDERVVADDTQFVDLASDSDDIELNRITRGWLSAGITHATTIFGGEGQDTFFVYSNKAVLRMEGEAGNDSFVIRAFVAEDDVIASGGGDDDHFEYNVNAPVSISGGTGFDTVVVIGTEKADNFIVTSEGIFGAGLTVRVDGVEEAIEVDGLEGDDNFFVLSTRDDVVTTVIGGLGSDTFNIAGDVTEDVISLSLEGRSSTINHGATSDDPSFDNLPVAGVPVTISDTPRSPVVISESDGFTEVVEDEAGSFDTYLVHLFRPDDDVSASAMAYLTVSAVMSSSADRRMPARGLAPGELDPQPAGPHSAQSVEISVDGGAWTTADVITFDHDSWSDDVEIRVRALHDDAIEGERKVMISHSLLVTSDSAVDVALFDEAPSENVEVRVLDDDLGALLVRESGNSTRVLEGGLVLNDGSILAEGATPGPGQSVIGDSRIVDEYVVRLSVKPTALVTVNLSFPGDELKITDEAGSEITSLEFDENNWDVERTITVEAISDGLRENAENHRILHSFDSSDSRYGASFELDVEFSDNAGEADARDTLIRSDGLDWADFGFFEGGRIDVVSGDNEGFYRIDQIAGDTIFFETGAEIITTSGSTSFLRTNPAPTAEVRVRVFDADTPRVLVTESDGSTRLIGDAVPPDVDDYSLRLVKQPSATVEVALFGDGNTRLKDDPRIGLADVGAPISVSADVNFVDNAASEANTQDTIERTDGGSWLDDGVHAGELIRINGDANAENNQLFRVDSVNDTVIRLTADASLTESLGATITLDRMLRATFADNSGIGDELDSLTRTDGGSWHADGFRIGTLFHVLGSGANDGVTFKVNSVSDDVLKLTADGALTAGDDLLVMIQRQTKSVSFTPTNWFEDVTIEVELDPNFVTDPTQELVRQEPLQPHVVDAIEGPLVLEGGIGEGKDRSLRRAVMLPTESTDAPLGIDDTTDESQRADRLNVFNDGSMIDDEFTLDATELRNEIVKLGNEDLTDSIRPMILSGPSLSQGLDVDISIAQDGTDPDQIIHFEGGIVFDDIEVTDILLGRGNDRIEVLASNTGTPGAEDLLVTVVHGGGNTEIATTTALSFSRNEADGKTTLTRDDLETWGVGYKPGLYLRILGDDTQNAGYYEILDVSGPAITLKGLVNEEESGNLLTARVMGDVIVAKPEGGAVAPLVLFGDTSQDGSRYDSLPEPGGVTGNAFFFQQHGDDVIDASQAGFGVAAYGGAGDDLIFGGDFGDHLAGGSGDDTIFGLAGDDHIYGDSGFNLEFSVSKDADGNASIARELTVPTLNESNIRTRDGLLAGRDALHGDQGEDVIFGDHGEVVQGEGTQRLFTTGDMVEIRSVRAVNGADDHIRGGAGNDLLLGGTGRDAIFGDEGNDLIFGDHGEVTADGAAAIDLGTLPMTSPEFAFTAITTTTTEFDAFFGTVVVGDDDYIEGGSGDDIALGQQGRDVIYGNDGDDDLIGGHNVEGGQDAGDFLDAGIGSDVVAGDNAIILRRGDSERSRFRVLQGDAIYGETQNLDDGDVLVSDVAQLDPSGNAARNITILDHSDTPTAGTWGADAIAGGAGDDELFGQLGDDTIQGDGALGPVDLGLSTGTGHALENAELLAFDGSDPYTIDGIAETITIAGHGLRTGDTVTYTNGGADDVGQLEDGVSYLVFVEDVDTLRLYEEVRAWRDGDGLLQVVPSSEREDDGDDYIEGGGGGDTLFGNLGQDDIVGGSSKLFGLNGAESQRPDGRDRIFGGAGLAEDLARNSYGDAGQSDGHARDADVIAGDNANVYRLLDGDGNLFTFNYDLSGDSWDSDYGMGLRIIPRAVEHVDYTEGGPDLDAASLLDNGSHDEIHGEAGDDSIYGQVGDDVIFGEGQDDDLIGGWGNDWISGGTGRDGVIGDDGRIYTSRNLGVGAGEEPLFGIAAIADVDLNRPISTPGDFQLATINVEGELKKSVNLTPFNVDPDLTGQDPLFDARYADDIIFGGLGDDFLHGSVGDDAISGAEALAESAVTVYPDDGTTDDLRVDGRVIEFGYLRPLVLADAEAELARLDPDAFASGFRVLGFETLKGEEFSHYEEFQPRDEILVDGKPYFLNFDPNEGPGSPETATTPTDGADRIFGDLGNDWIVGGTGRDNMYGGWGNDLLNADDDHSTNGGLNDAPDPGQPSFEDRAYGGAGRDVLIANTGGDRLIDWTGEFNSYIVPFAPFGPGTVSRQLPPTLFEFLYDLSASDGADATRGVDAGNALRNGEPHGELGLVIQKDPAWQQQTGAPDDPQQIGHIPGGPRDVLRTANFNAGTSGGFAADSGTWSVQDGRLVVAPETIDGDSVSVFFVDEWMPKYFEVEATINAVKPIAGYKANSYIVFDYHSETDFKFAGVNISTDKLEMGYRDELGWNVVEQVNAQLKPGQDYRVMLAVSGNLAILLVDGTELFEHEFEGRVDSDGFLYGLNAGMIGFGSTRAKGELDDIEVRVLAPEVTHEETQGFDTGSGIYLPQTGTWVTQSGQYVSAPSAAPASVSTFSFDVEPPSIVLLKAQVTTDDLAGIVFDYYHAEDFKYAAVDANSGEVVIGHRHDGAWYVDASADFGIQAGQSYDLKVELLGARSTLTVNGNEVLNFAFFALVNDGDAGMLSRGNSSFDDAYWATDDPGYAAPQNLLAAVAADTRLDVATLGLGPLDAVAGALVDRWKSSGLLDAAQMARLDSMEFALADLEGAVLGREAGGTVLIDLDAAGHGWYVDLTPWEDEEFLPGDEDGVLVASPDSEAAGHMDLMTVIAHELGHALGLEHADPVAGDAWMAESLLPGVRILPISGDPDARLDAVDYAAQLAADGQWTELRRSAALAAAFEEILLGDDGDDGDDRHRDAADEEWLWVDDESEATETSGLVVWD
ncbi:MAG: hypothetical protein AMJ58_07790, partial [Gammaproteobacteria bacterium SG8_30]